MERAITILYRIKPLIFAFGFLTPVLSQAMARIGSPFPPGQSAVWLAAAISGAWGLTATIRGRWL